MSRAKTFICLVIVAGLICACSEQPSNQNSDTSVEPSSVGASEQAEEFASAEQLQGIENSLLKSINKLANEQVSAVDEGSLNELERLSEQDRAELRDEAALELETSAEKKALNSSQKESSYRVPVD